MRAAVKRVVVAPFSHVTVLPIVKRISFHLKRISGGVDLHFFRTLLLTIIGFVLVAALLVTVFEVEKRSLDGLGD